jgi:hypothetical protein
VEDERTVVNQKMILFEYVSYPLLVAQALTPQGRATIRKMTENEHV